MVSWNKLETSSNRDTGLWLDQSSWLINCILQANRSTPVTFKQQPAVSDLLVTYFWTVDPNLKLREINSSVPPTGGDKTIRKTPSNEKGLLLLSHRMFGLNSFKKICQSVIKNHSLCKYFNLPMSHQPTRNHYHFLFLLVGTSCY